MGKSDKLKRRTRKRSHDGRILLEQSKKSPSQQQNTDKESITPERNVTRDSTNITPETPLQHITQPQTPQVQYNNSPSLENTYYQTSENSQQFYPMVFPILSEQLSMMYPCNLSNEPALPQLWTQSCPLINPSVSSLTNQFTVFGLHQGGLSSASPNPALIRQPTPTTTLSNASNESNKLVGSPIGVFWDIENCAVPRGKSAMLLVQRIRERFFREYVEAEFICVCDIRKESQQVIHELNDGQVTVIHVSGTSKNAADDKLRQAMRRYADMHCLSTRSDQTNPALLLISGDVNFASDLSDLRHRKRIHVILVHNKQAHGALLACANEHYDFHRLMDDLPNRSSTCPNDQRETRKTTGEFDILISGIPNRSMCSVMIRLKKLCDNLGGKILQIIGQFAIIRFSSQEAVLRALKRMNGEIVLGSKISATYPISSHFGVPPSQSRLPSTVPPHVAPLTNFNQFPSEVNPCEYLPGKWPQMPWPNTNLPQMQGYVPTMPISWPTPPQAPLVSMPWLIHTPTQHGPISSRTVPIPTSAQAQNLLSSNPINSPSLTPVNVKLPSQPLRPPLSKMYNMWAESADPWQIIKSMSSQPQKLQKTTQLIEKKLKTVLLVSESGSEGSSEASADEVGANLGNVIHESTTFGNTGEHQSIRKNSSAYPETTGSESEELLALIQGFSTPATIYTNNQSKYTFSESDIKSVSNIIRSSTDIENDLHGLQPMHETSTNLSKVAKVNTKAFETKSSKQESGFRLSSLGSTSNVGEKVQNIIPNSKNFVAITPISESSAQKQVPVASENVDSKLCVGSVGVLTHHVNTLSLQPVIVDLNHGLELVTVNFSLFSHRVKKLIQCSEAQELRINSFKKAYESKFEALSFTEKGCGVPLHHLIHSVEGVEVNFDNKTNKTIGYRVQETKNTFRKSGITESFCLQSTKLKVELVNLLQICYRALLRVSDVPQRYQNYYKKALDLTAYGYPDLLSFVQAESSTLHFVGEIPNLFITLTHEVQMKRFSVDVLRVLKSRGERKEITLMEFSRAFDQLFPRQCPFQAENYGLCSLADLVTELIKKTSLITLQEQNGSTTITMIIHSRESTRK